MRERGILMQPPMVRGTLAGTKTQTRRVVAFSNDLPAGATPGSPFVSADKRTAVTFGWPVDKFTSGATMRECPYGVPGDRLWVREPFRTFAAFDAESMGDLQLRLQCTDADMPRVVPIEYLADAERRNWLAPDAQPGRYRHARFMPRWASRILLEVTGVRVERLQAISEPDATAEGLIRVRGPLNTTMWEYSETVGGQFADPRVAYHMLWDEIHGPGSWALNPWVWVVEFRRLQP